MIIAIDEMARRYGKLPSEIMKLPLGEFFMNLQIMQKAKEYRQADLRLKKIPVFPVIEVD